MNEKIRNFSTRQLIGVILLSLFVSFILVITFGEHSIKPTDLIDMKFVDDYAKQHGFDPITRNVTANEICYKKDSNTFEQLCLELKFDENTTKSTTVSTDIVEVKH